MLEVMCKATGLRIGLCAPTICIGAIDNLSHQHSKVRTNTLQALGTLFEKTGNCELLKTLYPILKQKLRYDRTVAVRSTLYEVVKNWLLSFPYESLTYEIDLEGKGTPVRTETQLTYLLLSGLGDSEKAVSERIFDYMTTVGERRLNVARDFNEEITPGIDAKQFQVLIVLPHLVRLSLADCTEWTVHEKSKTRGAVVLLALTKIAGEHLKPHIDTILKTVIKCYTDSEDAEQKGVYEDLVGTMANGCSFEGVTAVLTKSLAPDQSSVSQRASIFVCVILDVHKNECDQRD